MEPEKGHPPHRETQASEGNRRTYPQEHTYGLKDYPQSGISPFPSPHRHKSLAADNKLLLGRRQNYFQGLKIYFQALVIYFQGLVIYFQALKIIL